MELLLINHAESLKNEGVLLSHDSGLTHNGIRQVSATATWFSQNFSFKGYKGFTSPYLRTLQTASIISDLNNITFTVDCDLKEHLFSKSNIKIPDRSLLFSNIHWVANDWTEPNIMVPETIEEHINKLNNFLFYLSEIGDKFVLVTHPITMTIITELLMHNNETSIKKSILATEARLHSDPLDDNEIGIIRNCGVTWIKKDELIWFSNVVYE